MSCGRHCERILIKPHDVVSIPIDTVRYAFAEHFEVRQPIRQAGVLNYLSVELLTIVLAHTSVRVEHVKTSVLGSCCQQVTNLVVVRWKAVPYANDDTRRGERRARQFPCRLKRLGRPFAPDGGY